MKEFIIFVFSLIFLAGCSFHKGMISPSYVQFTSPNFNYVNSIEGEASAIYILGIGGLEINGLVNEAKTNMYSNFFLKKNQVITNVTEDVKKTLFLPFFTKHKVIITADVYEFINE